MPMEERVAGPGQSPCAHLAPVGDALSFSGVLSVLHNPFRFLSPGLPLPGFSGPVRMPRAWVACVNTDPGRRPVRCRFLGSQHSYSLRDCGVNWGSRGGEGYGTPCHQEAYPRWPAEEPACLGCPLPRCLFAVTTLNT